MQISRKAFSAFSETGESALRSENFPCFGGRMMQSEDPRLPVPKYNYIKRGRTQNTELWPLPASNHKHVAISILNLFKKKNGIGKKRFCTLFWITDTLSRNSPATALKSGQTALDFQ